MASTATLPSAARLGGILALAERSERFRELAERLEDRRSTKIADASAGARAFAWAALVEVARRNLVVIAPSEDRARRWRAELAAWLGEERVLSFPERETMPYEIGTASAGAVHQRLLTLWRAHTATEPVAIVVSLRALMQHTIAPADLRERGRTLRAGDRVSWNETAAWLFDLGYEPVAEVAEPGSFSRRGGILDVYPASADMPIRVELFGDDIETLRRFDPVTQRSQDAVDAVDVLPAREYSLESAAALAERLAAADWDHPRGEGDELASYSALVEALREGRAAPGTDAFAAALGATASLLDHLGDRATVVFEDSVELGLTQDAHEAQADERREELREQGLAVAAFPPPYVPRDRIDAAADEHGAVRVRPDADALRLGWGGITSYAGRLDAFLREVAATGRDLRVVASPQAARLAELLADRDVTTAPRDAVHETPSAGALVLAHVGLAEGFSVPELALRVFTDAEVFGFRKPRHPERRRRRVAVGSFLSDLKPGDHVVHEDHGIARFERFITREIAGVVREYLELRFAGTDVVALPTERVDRVTRYVGGTPPALSALGGRDWAATKRKAKKAVEEIARELLRLYAARETISAYAFGKDTPWQIEMENAFPFTETPDQLAAIEDTKRDLERARPMDRLVVGDVGYGKTEVALRAAFKAVQDGKQVAVLVPTTVLAQQHLLTFQRRLAAFPIEIGMLSRFVAKKEQGRIVEGVAGGTVDILIGTHRSLSKDIEFADLGRLVVDEEQRFGVSHKERIKQMRREVDVLTLSATPIPRTLHLSLVGIRDLSVIETPPEARLPIQTRIAEDDDGLVRDAINREIDRGGQVFYVHNRVETIEAAAERVRRLVPGARIAIGHGQMAEGMLERVMLDFSDGRFDVLVCTTIIESGLDIPNANTIIIVRADTFGLAQLYQLRGRVGRSDRRAHAYLLHRRGLPLSPVARKRLHAIFSASDLGAGYQIALSDLEIRGAGNILGAEQHGFMAAVGFEMYTRLLAEAVDMLRGRMPVPEPSPVRLDLPGSAYLPDDYVADSGGKLEAYRRFAQARSGADTDALRADLRDRYGPVPTAVEGLFTAVRVRQAAEAAGVPEVRVEERQVTLKWARLPDRREVSIALQFSGLRPETASNQVRIPVAAGHDPIEVALRSLEAVD